MVFVAYLVLYLIAFIMGSCVASFLNVVIYRLPRKLSLVKGRSFCPNCCQILKVYDMVPVFSWFWLKGRCRFCNGKISARYPLVEAMGGFAALFCVALWGYSLAALTIFAAVMILVTVAFIDHDTFEIPNGLVIALLIPAVLSIGVFPDVSILERGVGVVALSGPMLLMNLLVRDSFGGGDIKLIAVCGFLLGWKLLLVGGFVALVLAGGYGVYLLKTRKKGRKDHIAFGPHLALGMIFALYVGRPILDRYLSLFI